MPTVVDENASALDFWVTRDWLLQRLRTNPKELIILDCRSTNEYGESHIRQAVNFSIPSIMLRRLSAGKIDLISTIKCQELKERVVEGYKRDMFVVYDNDSDKTDCTSEVLQVLIKRLKQDGCRVVCLQEGFASFSSSFPEWCESSTEVGASGGTDPVAAPLMGLRSLRISTSPVNYRERDRHRFGSSCGSSAATSSTESSDTDDKCDSSLGLEDDKDFPVEILPHLFLGNAVNSEDSESLQRHGIQYILNVTADLPNVFEECGGMKYMQIPIADHWSENLAKFFPKAISFIEEGRNNSKGVLVHCLAGVSRSVTITVAYLMYKLNLSLNDAFTLVRNRKSNVGPNFHFMEQLHTFEQELKTQGRLPECKEEDEKEEGEAAAAATTTTTPAPVATAIIIEEPKEPEPSEEEKIKALEEEASRNQKCEKCKMPIPQCKCKASQFLNPLAIGTSPDSGIEFDRWTPQPGPGQ